MLQIRRILLRGNYTQDADISFGAGANILSGESDTGKSFLVHCLDYVLGAKVLKKKFDLMTRYTVLFVEFVNDKSEKLTLERSLSGGHLFAHSSDIDGIRGVGRKVLSKGTGKAASEDVTSVLFPFAGIPHAQLRKNARGELLRLTIRLLIPVFLIDEKSVISDDSPITGRASFDVTARKRMLAFMLSGVDDKGLVASEKKDIAKAKLSAQLALIDKLIAPLEQRLVSHVASEAAESVEKIGLAIAHLALALEANADEREALQTQRRIEIDAQQYAESQILAINELRTRYDLLDDRYRSDLKRLDFVAEGSHYLDSLQLVNCPCCNQPLTLAHTSDSPSQVDSATLHAAASAEAKKILALIKDLAATKQTLEARKSSHEQTLRTAESNLLDAETRLSEVLAPATKVAASEVDILVSRRLELESLLQDQTQLDNLRTMKAVIEKTSNDGGGDVIEWESLPTKPLALLCTEVEKVLVEWKWAESCRVEFDETEFDIIVDGQSRQSHGKGVRGVLYSAFVLGLLKFCKINNRPHPGLVVIDSPLTSYKKAPKANKADVPLAAGVEAAFWQSLRSLTQDLQVIVIENKEPPQDIAMAVHYERFAGEGAVSGERAGFIPTSS